MQMIIEVNERYDVIDSWLAENSVRCLMLVCGKSIKKQKIDTYFTDLPSHLNVKVIRFTAFQPNPTYENIVEGVRVFRREGCDAIIAVGGGSAIDVAKCIKLYSFLSGDGRKGEWLKAREYPNEMPFLVMPTTAGSGSEATRFAVIYYKGTKQSISDCSIIPRTVLLDSSVLKTLPEYQKKSTMMDALCHAVESYWSLNSTEESKNHSKKAIQIIMEYMDEYLLNTDIGNARMLLAANEAGKAINIAQTTAGHAMCYKITSLFGCAHGHAAAMCDRVLFPWMINNIDKCIDPRGIYYFAKTLDEIGQAMGCANANEAAVKLNMIFEKIAMGVPTATTRQFKILKESVNPIRLKNHPIALSVDMIDALYHEILLGEK